MVRMPTGSPLGDDNARNNPPLAATAGCGRWPRSRSSSRSALPSASSACHRPSPKPRSSSQASPAARQPARSMGDADSARAQPAGVRKWPRSLRPRRERKRIRKHRARRPCSKPRQSRNRPARRRQTLQIMAVVNGEQITRTELGRECIRRYGEEVLESMVNRQLIPSVPQKG